MMICKFTDTKSYWDEKAPTKLSGNWDAVADYLIKTAALCKKGSCDIYVDLIRIERRIVFGIPFESTFWFMKDGIISSFDNPNKSYLKNHSADILFECKVYLKQLEKTSENDFQRDWEFGLEELNAG